jgi:lysophospholipase L1-like esterase
MSDFASDMGLGDILVGRIPALFLTLYVLVSAPFIAYLVVNTYAGHVLGVTIGLIENPEITAVQREMVAHHMRLDRNLTPGRLIFLGDSHILGLDTMQVAPDGVNFGIGGETTVGLLARIDHYQSVRQARAVVMGTGYNDIRLREAGEIVNIIRDILSRLSVPVLLTGILPVSPAWSENPGQAAKMNATIASINAALRSICTKDCIFVDPEPVFGALTEKAAYYESDGIHLNARGYRVWTKLISRYAVAL